MPSDKHATVSKRLGRPRKTEYPPPVEGDFQHGTPTGYNWHGCRCGTCAAWIRENRHRLYVQRRKRAGDERT